MEFDRKKRNTHARIWSSYQQDLPGMQPSVPASLIAQSKLHSRNNLSLIASSMTSILFIYLVMVGKMAIGDSNGSRSHDCIDHTITTFCHRDMIDPNISSSKNINTITITFCPKPKMIFRVSNQTTVSFFNTFDMNIMYDHIFHELQR